MRWVSFDPPFPSEVEEEKVDERTDNVWGMSLLEEKAISEAMEGVRKDFAELGENLKSSFSLFSVKNLSKLTSSFLQLGADEPSEQRCDDMGVTKDVLEFARRASQRPETWLEFLSMDKPCSFDNFVLSNAQQGHASYIEHLVPEMAAVKLELCPHVMSEGHFWKIYFALLHPILNKDDAKLLSTPQMVKARDVMMQGLQNSAMLYGNVDSRTNDSGGDNDDADGKGKCWSFRLGDFSTDSFVDLEDDDDDDDNSMRMYMNLRLGDSPSSSFIELENNGDDDDAIRKCRNLRLGDSPSGSFIDLEDDNDDSWTICESSRLGEPPAKGLVDFVDDDGDGMEKHMSLRLVDSPSMGNCDAMESYVGRMDESYFTVMQTVSKDNAEVGDLSEWLRVDCLLLSQDSS
ncbi:uncharacterized protein LOC18446360 [Amborella trichopoda]|uniref:BSD domain-containing protein n=1 Tax=Amborella trichopoda TaxID=13333 RepID=U5D6F6_AMBTC|nr:uncharacterized protein LOC18446360 [Amborella trichopoda]ERN18009.1 hypothetical protein AMTR_s00046p00160890 [Amborella trichopoda]|eukprot:XP_020530617.1 uncharacterized protein LOC18446360 [Amborella trichopoda]